MFHNTLVAYDDSPGARRALDIALQLADRRPEVRLTAIAVQPQPARFGGTIDEYQEERTFEEQRCHQWLAAASAIAATHDIPLEPERRFGHPAQEIVNAAEALGADLIIVGHSGHSAVWGRFLGTTAEKVSRHAHCSVLIAAPLEGRAPNSRG
jgi:nucleotide-binding universal stress UspA family protein